MSKKTLGMLTDSRMCFRVVFVPVVVVVVKVWEPRVWTSMRWTVWRGSTRMVIRESVPCLERLLPSRSRKRFGWALFEGRLLRKDSSAAAVLIISASMFMQVVERICDIDGCCIMRMRERVRSSRSRRTFLPKRLRFHGESIYCADLHDFCRMKTESLTHRCSEVGEGNMPFGLASLSGHIAVHIQHRHVPGVLIALSHVERGSSA